MPEFDGASSHRDSRPGPPHVMADLALVRATVSRGGRWPACHTNVTRRT